MLRTSNRQRERAAAVAACASSSLPPWHAIEFFGLHDAELLKQITDMAFNEGEHAG